MKKLKRVWRIWKRIGQAIGDLIGRLVLTVFYFTLMIPFGLGVRLFGSPLRMNRSARSLWQERKTFDMSLEDVRKLS